MVKYRGRGGWKESYRHPGDRRLEGPPPCFYAKACGGTSAVEKEGKSVCRSCAARLQGEEYRLRAPSRALLYPNALRLAEELDMIQRRKMYRYI